MKNNDKNPQDDSLPFISLDTFNDLKTRRTGWGSNSSSHESITESNFRNMIFDALSVGKVKSSSFESSYFFIDLTYEYYNNSVVEMLKDLDLEIKTVLNDYQIIVKANPVSISGYIQNREKIPKKITGTIRKIYCLKGEDKLGSNLLKFMNQDPSPTRVFNVSIKLLDNLSEEEETEFNRIVSQHIQREINPKYLPRSKQFVCGSNARRILEISELPFIKKISITPKLKPQRYRSGELVYSSGSYEIVKNEDVPIICVIDSGTGECFKDFCILQDSYEFDNPYDSVDHGTMVASVASFGEDIIDKKSTLKQKAKIISFKLDDGSEDEDVPLEEAVMTAIDEFRNLTSVFCLSYNYYDDIDPEDRLDIVKKLDNFIQKSNVVLVNSCGNIDLSTAYERKNDYPRYLSIYPVLCPSEAKNVFSVGSICKQSSPEKCIPSCHTRIGLHPIFLNEDLDKYRFFKPDVSTFGGNSELKFEELSEGSSEVAVSPDLEIGVMNNDGDIVNAIGTSFSAPLIALCFARLYDDYNYNNSEMYKAILINKAICGNINELPFFYLLNTNNITTCSDGIYLNFEGEVAPKHRSEDISRTYIYECKTVEFYMPKEAESLDIITVHSNNYAFQDTRMYNTRLVIEIIKSNDVTIKKKYGTISRNCANTFAHYNFKKDYVGLWKIKIHVETRGLMPEMLEGLQVRFGVSVRINLKEEHRKNLHEIYLQLLEKSKVKVNEQVREGVNKSIDDLIHQSANVTLTA